MKRSDEDIDRLLHDWHRVAATATPPADPATRRTVRGGPAAVPASLLALVVVVAVAVLLGRGQPGPASSPVPSDLAAAASAPTAAIAVMRDERFELRLTVAKERYTEGDDILAQASVTYLGPDGTTTVSHGGSPVLFTVKEVGGSREILGGMDTPCLRSEWPKDVPQVFPWERSGGYSTTDMTEAGRFAKAYLEDGPAGGLRLPAGTWRLGVTLLVTPGAECAPTEQMTVEVEIPVDPATAEATAAPVPDPSPTPAQAPASSPAAGPIVRCDGLQPGDCEGAIAVARQADPIGYADAGLVVAAGACRLPPGVDGSIACPRFSAYVVFDPGGDGRPASVVSVEGTDQPETVSGRVEGPDWLEAIVDEWDIVGDGVLVPIPLGEPSLPGEADSCGGAVVRGVLVEHATLGLGLELDDGTTRPVQWPFGYVGYRGIDGLGMLDLDGARVAGVGQTVLLHAEQPGGGGQAALVGCGSVTLVTLVEPGPDLALGPVVRCVRVGPDDCEGSVALARELWPNAYEAAELVLVADGCGPDPDCDGFAAIVAFLPRPGEAMGQTVIVRGTSGPEVANPTQTPAMLTDELDQLAEQGFDGGDGATLFQVRTEAPLAPGETHACPAASISGTLAENAETGIGLIASGQSMGVKWPFGFAGRRDATGVSLVDVEGVVVGRVGESFTGGGQGVGGDPPLVRVCSY